MADITGTGDDNWHEVIVAPDPGLATILSLHDMVGLQKDNDRWLKTRLVGCYRSIEQATVSNNAVFDTVDEVSATGSWEAILGVTLTLASAPVEGDLLIISGVVHAQHVGGAVVGTDYVGLQLSTPAGPIFPNSTAKYLSIPSGEIHCVNLGAVQRVGGAPVGSVVALSGYKAGAGKLVVKSPAVLRVNHMRPIAAP